jgi:superfamily II DNA helicase RecQ
VSAWITFTYIIHLNLPYNMKDFLQQSSRGGKGGEFVRSIVFITKEQKKELRRQLDDVKAMTHDEAAMMEFMVTSGCRRPIASAYIDGEDNKVDCQSPVGAAQCDNCSRSHDDPEDGGVCGCWTE